jgi:hypothetical protein
MLSHGADGLKQASEDAVLNANYILRSMEDILHAPFAASGPCMHEALFGDKDFTQGLTTLDVAKGLIDEGYHPMTVYFPLVVHGAMLVEPTETESKAAIDQFITAFRAVVERALAGDEALKQAPYYAPRRRLARWGCGRWLLRWPLRRWRLVAHVDRRRDGLQRGARTCCFGRGCGLIRQSSLGGKKPQPCNLSRAGSILSRVGLRGCLRAQCGRLCCHRGEVLLLVKLVTVVAKRAILRCGTRGPGQDMSSRRRAGAPRVPPKALRL